MSIERRILQGLVVVVGAEAVAAVEYTALPIDRPDSVRVEPTDREAPHTHQEAGSGRSAQPLWAFDGGSTATSVMSIAGSNKDLLSLNDPQPVVRCEAIPGGWKPWPHG